MTRSAAPVIVVIEITTDVLQEKHDASRRRPLALASRTPRASQTTAPLPFSTPPPLTSHTHTPVLQVNKPRAFQARIRDNARAHTLALSLSLSGDSVPEGRRPPPLLVASFCLLEDRSGRRSAAPDSLTTIVVVVVILFCWSAPPPANPVFFFYQDGVRTIKRFRTTKEGIARLTTCLPVCLVRSAGWATGLDRLSNLFSKK